MNNKTLRQHAYKELELLNIEQNYPDAYNTVKSIVDALEDFREGYGEQEAGYVMDMFEMLLRGDNLAPITDNPEDWDYLSEAEVWQNYRNPNVYSTDGGRTWFDARESDSKSVLSLVSGKRGQSKKQDNDKGKTGGSTAKQGKAKQSNSQGKSTQEN